MWIFTKVKGTDYIVYDWSIAYCNIVIKDSSVFCEIEEDELYIKTALCEGSIYSLQVINKLNMIAIFNDSANTFDFIKHFK